MPPNPVVAFGASENSFYIGCGMRYYAPGLPDPLALAVMNLPAIDIPWLALDGNAEAWVTLNSNKGTFNYSTNLPKDVIEAMGSTTEYVTLGPTKAYYFVKLGSGQWKANLPDGVLKSYHQIRATSGPAFDTGLTGMIFGKGNSIIYMFNAGYFYSLDDEAVGGNLIKVFDEFLKNNEWILLPGSSLCPWNIEYFYLMFKSKVNGGIQMRWNLPSTMQAKLMELRQQADTPQEKLVIQTYRQQSQAVIERQVNDYIQTQRRIQEQNHDRTMEFIRNINGARYRI